MAAELTGLYGYEAPAAAANALKVAERLGPGDLRIFWAEVVALLERQG